MDMNGILTLLAILETAYPYFYKDTTKDEKKRTAALWFEMLSDVPLETAKIGLKKLIATHKNYPPTIAHLREAIADVSQERPPDPGEAWGEVVKAIQRFGYIRADEGLASLTPLTRKAVEFIGWQTLCQSENETADRAHFMKIMQTMALREHERQVLPASLQDKIDRLIEQNKPEAKYAVRPVLTVLDGRQAEPEPQGLAGTPENVFERLRKAAGA